jgi:drug/metabolite transporter (DMT)-like permease
MDAGPLLGLGSAFAFGLCDFVAGIGSRALSFWWVTLVSLLTSSLGAWALVVLQGDHATQPAVLWGLAAGIGAGTGASALYRGYGHGEMAVAGPLSAVGTAALPALAGVAFGERLSTWAVVGVLAAMPALWLMSSTSDGGGTVRAGVVDGVLSGLGFALEFIALERAGDASGLWPVAVSQTMALLTVLVVVLTRRPAVRRGWRPLVLAAAAGALSLLATSLYFLASHAGTLTVAAVLAALYPGVTVALAAAVLRERPDRRQVSGLLIGAVAVTLIVAG